MFFFVVWCFGVFCLWCFVCVWFGVKCSRNRLKHSDFLKDCFKSFKSSKCRLIELKFVREYTNITQCLVLQLVRIVQGLQILVVLEIFFYYKMYPCNRDINLFESRFILKAFSVWKPRLSNVLFERKKGVGYKIWNDKMSIDWYSGISELRILK